MTLALVYKYRMHETNQKERVYKMLFSLAVTYLIFELRTKRSDLDIETSFNKKFENN